LGILGRSYDEVHGAPDLVGDDDGLAKLDTFMMNESDSPALIDELVAQIQAGTLASFAFLHIAEADYAGHTRGWDISPGSIYRAAVRIADAQLGALLDAVEAQPGLTGKLAIILTTDHGGGGGISTRTWIPCGRRILRSHSSSQRPALAAARIFTRISRIARTQALRAR
jgi:predicted AlkP superfamily pyrophosphatase or phosphodiesterase